MYIHTQTSHCSIYTYTQQYQNSVYMKFTIQTTLKWAAQRMHREVIKLVMHNANTGAIYCMD